MKAIDTIYNGYKFRSRLEARWAVFFDEAGIIWEYEKEGYDLGDGVYYLPDFWLPQLDIFVEVKGSRLSKADTIKVERLAEQSNKRVAVVGSIPDEDVFDNYDKTYLGQMFASDWYDEFYFFCRCPKCRSFGYEFEGRIRQCDCDSMDGEELKNSNQFDYAYTKARQARFEHGEKPKQNISVEKTKLNENWLADLADRFGDDECKKKYGKNKN